ncbi:hypothetical protein, unlikely [Trypanosoma brucei gambiense DAL972]|uniref:Uncharacterized protein n=1 Tax=Trypanosoma brucei gambiense (strain MHOM/CI/86/DAL972) TaxID=679716 RepID=C9ZU32_TRYB9|nr:hypothetical protein, unlikely [Trypanosoma brucei gambiense DAL972]CBH12918.1 hypothetical protein, unlikely [Trypanosoma brucei gambiense DAL972]|eukprot:XP_011775197.1 hypothetical protein, unlikely [Trypanosoma brucei gambiense DAL972]
MCPVKGSKPTPLTKMLLPPPAPPCRMVPNEADVQPVWLCTDASEAAELPHLTVAVGIRAVQDHCAKPKSAIGDAFFGPIGFVVSKQTGLNGHLRIINPQRPHATRNTYTHKQAREKLLDRLTCSERKPVNAARILAQRNCSHERQDSCNPPPRHVELFLFVSFLHITHFWRPGALGRWYRSPDMDFFLP